MEIEELKDRNHVLVAEGSEYRTYLSTNRNSEEALHPFLLRHQDMVHGSGCFSLKRM
jgi:hypothetical protein